MCEFSQSAFPLGAGLARAGVDPDPGPAAGSTGRGKHSQGPLPGPAPGSGGSVCSRSGGSRAGGQCGTVVRSPSSRRSRCPRAPGTAVCWERAWALRGKELPLPPGGSDGQGRSGTCVPRGPGLQVAQQLLPPPAQGAFGEPEDVVPIAVGIPSCRVLPMSTRNSVSSGGSHSTVTSGHPASPFTRGKDREGSLLWGLGRPVPAA